MSEVNQAFLRAYLKSRAAQTPPGPSAPVSMETRPQPNPNDARPSAAAPRKPSVPPTQPSQTSPSGMNRRFDPSHAAPNVAAQPILPAQPAQPIRPQARVSPRQGVWSPLGAERGMKALESTSIPAVVRNGVAAVTSEAARYRRPTVDPIPQQVPSVQKAPNPQRSMPQAYAATVSYDQVMYVDGLAGHALPQRSPGSRPNERTLAEIAEPIAFGTGAQSTQSPLNNAPTNPPPQPSQNNSNPSVTRRVSISVAPEALPLSARQTTTPAQLSPQPAVPSPANETNVTRRIDPSHQRSSDGSLTANPLPPKAKTTTHLNAGLPLPVAFHPSWEVDQFFWPEVVKQIESSHADAFLQIGKHLGLANRDGLKVMAITSGERGVGRSTVAMHMARCAASTGLRVALVDGDTFCPSLVDQLRLDMEQGWQDCLFENIPLQDIAIHSIADQVTLFPLTSVVSQQQMHANLQRMAKLIRRISNAFDMVFIDGNRLNLEQRDLVGVAQESVVDAAIVVVDTELSIKEKVDSAVSILQGMGISSIGLVENFQS